MIFQPRFIHPNISPMSHLMTEELCTGELSNMAAKCWHQYNKSSCNFLSAVLTNSACHTRFFLVAVCFCNLMPATVRQQFSSPSQLSSNPASDSIAYSSLVLKSCLSLKWGSFSKFIHVLAVGNRSSLPALCMHKAGYSSYIKGEYRLFVICPYKLSVKNTVA